MCKCLAQFIYSEYHEIYTTLGVFDLVNKTASIIEINGSRYDAVSGRLIGAAKKAAHQIKRPIEGLSIDGFTKPAKIIKKSAIRRSIYTLQRQVPSGTWQRKPQRSKTLMRSGVEKPAPKKPESRLKTRGLAPNYARAARAANVAQSPKVQRYGTLSYFSKNKAGQAKTGEIIPRGAHFATAASASLSATLPALGSASHHKLERLLDYALANADSHKKAGELSRRNHRKFLGLVPRWATLSLLVIVLAVVIGIIVWQKIPAASMKLAATKAHINASLPTPISGYKIGPITAGNHAVITTIQSISDSSKKYTVTEQAANQPSTSLKAVTAGSGHQVQTVQDQDKTYILTQDHNRSQAACTKGNNTVSVDGVGLDVSELLEAAKNACES